MTVLDRPRVLTDGELDVFSRLHRVIVVKRHRNRLRTAYIEAKKRLDKIGFSIPENMVDFQTPLGWCAKAVSVPAKRIRPDGFTLNGSSALLGRVLDVMDDAYFEAIERMAIESSLEHSVSFVFTSRGDAGKGEPEVIFSAKTALEATAEVDPRTNRVTSALELVSKSEVLLYLPGKTLDVEMVNGDWRVTAEFVTVSGRVMCTPYVWGRSLSRPFGHSRVSRPLMGFVDSGVRTMLRQESHAEVFSRPQRALLGASDVHFFDSAGKPISALDILTGAIWGIPDVLDEESGELKRPDLKQLSQASMQPHMEMLRGLAMQVASETDIPVSYLGVIHDNPSSADAIRAAEAPMSAMIEAEFPSIGMSRTDLARNVAAVLDEEWTPVMAAELRGLRARFLDPGTPTIAARADSGQKFASTFPDADPVVAMEIYGMNGSQIERMMSYKNRLSGTSKLAAMVAAAKANSATPDAAADVPAAG